MASSHTCLRVAASAKAGFGETRRSIPSFDKATEDYTFRIHPTPLLLRKKLRVWLSAKAGKKAIF
jgi:hypothetical protein